jgi:hypothetical protein
MENMVSRITIKSKLTGVQMVFNNQINAVEIERTFKNSTQTAVVKLPRYPKLVDPNETDYKIRTGDSVIIQLGYNGNYYTEYIGYVSLIKPTTPLEIHCEDEMWKYKQVTVNKAWPSISMKELISYLVPGTDVSLVPDITLAPFRIERVSVAKALEKLKEYGLAIYFRHGKLFVGFPYFDTNVGSVNYHFEKNAIAEGLEFRKADDVKIKLTAISMLRNNTTLKVEVGDSDGESHTSHFYNISSEAELKQLADQELIKYKRDGLTGSFKGFGVPFCDHGWTCNLMSNSYPERAGTYFIDSVKINYDSNGYRRTITPGRRALS